MTVSSGDYTMQMMKKIFIEDDSKEQCQPRVCRQTQKMTVISERKVNELISSSKQKKRAEIHSRGDADLIVDMDSAHGFLEDEADCISLTYQTAVDHMRYGEKILHGSQRTIFSSPYGHSKLASGGISSKVDFKSAFTRKNQTSHSDLSITDLRTTYLASFDKLGHKNFTEDKMEYDLMQTDKKNVELEISSSNHSDADSKDGHIILVGSDFGKSLSEDEFSGIDDLSPDVSAIYLAMKQSNLEYVDEKSQGTVCEEVCLEHEDDDFDDFDPFLFIKDLPDLSAVVPRYRSMLLPKQTRSCPPTTLVLDLDETLVHSTLEPCKGADFTFPVNFNLKEHTIYVRCRPFLKDFMDRVATLFETIIFTASQSIYAEQLLNMLDPKRKLFRHRVFRESCVFVDGNYLKDLSVLGRDLAHVIIVDNSPQAFGFQLDNGIPIESWFDDRSDRELLSLLPFLEGLAGAEDVRPLIAQKFKLRQKVETAALSFDFRS